MANTSGSHPDSATPPTALETAENSSSEAVRVACQELVLYDTGDVDGADVIFAPDLVDHNPPEPHQHDHVDGMRALIAAVRDGFSDTQHRILFHRDLGDGWVVIKWRMTARHTGTAFGIPPTGRAVSIEGCDIMRVSAGRIAEIHHVEEMGKLFAQLGRDQRSSQGNRPRTRQED